MNKIMTVSALSLALLLALQTRAEPSSVSRSESRLSGSGMSVKEIRERLQIRGDIYLLDSSGQRLLFKASNSGTWQPNNKEGKIESYWSATSNQFAPVNIHHTWEVDNEGRIHAHIEQYAKVTSKPGEGSRGVKLSELLKSQDFVIENFAPLTWVVEKSADSKNSKRVVVRFTPELRENFAPEALSFVPVSGSEMSMIDSQRRLWADRVSLSGKYVAITTHLGTVALSYYPFKDAKEVGYVSGHRMELDLGGSLKLSLASETPFLPQDMNTKVYGFYKPELKTSRVNSTRTSATNREDELFQHLHL
jgi:hypothetical protein